MEVFGLEGTFKGHLVQPPYNEQGHLQPHQVAQSPVQPDLEYFQEENKREPFVLHLIQQKFDSWGK